MRSVAGAAYDIQPELCTSIRSMLERCNPYVASFKLACEVDAPIQPVLHNPLDTSPLIEAGFLVSFSGTHPRAYGNYKAAVVVR